jgi:hypothetical protein
MNYFLIQATLIAGIGDEESTFWIQILVFVLLGASWGVYNLVKKRQDEFKDEHEAFAEERVPGVARGRRRLGLAGRVVSLCKDAAQKYAAKIQVKRIHIPKLIKEPIFNIKRPERAIWKMLEKEPATKKHKDLHSGMEILELDFLLSIVEDTESNDENDIIMRKLYFNELIRRRKLNQVNSKVLKVYAINRDSLYGKDIQCESIRQLAERTTHKIEHSPLEPALSLSS